MVKYLQLFFIALFIAFIPFSLTAEDRVVDPVHWTFSVRQKDQSTFVLLFDAKIDESWRFYSQHLPQSPPGTAFSFVANASYERVGMVEESFTKEKFEESLGVSVNYFSTFAQFQQKVLLKEDGPIKIEGSLEYMACRDQVCLSPEEVSFSFTLPGDTVGIQQDLVADESLTDTRSKNNSLITFFVLSFAAGLAAILTPCVFPMIPMTVSFFMHKGEGLGRMYIFVYGLSIIAFYILLGTLLSMLIGPGFASWLATHWLPNVLFFFVFLFFAAALLGMFELQLPRWLIDKSDRQADKGGIIGVIFMSITLVLVSFSCTGPIVGTILVESAGGMVIKPVVGMLGFSLAFALPFTFFAFFPGLLSKMPKSGSWLNTAKVILGFLELALALKFLSVADQAYHWGILGREIYLALWIAIFSLLGAYLIGLFSLPQESNDRHRVSVPKLFTAVLVFAFVVYLIPGMFGAPLKSLSGYLPPLKEKSLPSGSCVKQGAEVMTGCERPKYQDFLHLPHQLDGYFDLAQALSCAKARNKPVLIDFTGHACVNCREMEATVWADPRVLELFNQYVLLALYVDDNTPLPDDQHYVSPYDNKVKKTLGRRNSDLEIRLFQINAQPYYVLIDAKGDLLAPSMSYDLDADHFVSFLELGLKNFKSGERLGHVDHINTFQ